MKSLLNQRLVLAWLFSIPITYLVFAYLDVFYTHLFEVLLLVVVIQTGMNVFVYFSIRKLKEAFQLKPKEIIITFLVFVSLIFFRIRLTLMVNRFPLLFDSTLHRLNADLLLPLIIGLCISLLVSAWFLLIAHSKNFRQTRLYSFIDANLSGIFIALVFFSIYFLLANIFNQPYFNFDDIFFDTDTKLWRTRFGTQDYKDYYERTVHPFVLIIILPWVNLISLFLKGDLLHASFVLIALTGAFGVFLAWYFVKEKISSSLYALLIASLFGASTSQLVFGSTLETYGFLGTVALIFIILLLKDAPIWALITAGLASFGITISNLAQTVIAYFIVKRNFWGLVKYVLIILALIVPLNLLNNLIYPKAHPYLWDVTTLQYEEQFVFTPTIQRANYLARVMALNSIVAPYPVLFKEDIPFIKIWMFYATTKTPLRVAKYQDSFSSFLVYVWAGLVFLGAVLFLKNISKQDNRFSFAFILTTLFFFVLHMRYGRDVFLYSSNWTYAIILFLALAWKELANKLWFQITLLAFWGLLIINNSKLIEVMLTVSVLHIK